VSDFVEGGTSDEYINLIDFSIITFNGNQTGNNAYEIYFDTADKKNGADNLLANIMPTKTTYTDVAEFSIRGFGNDSAIAIKFPISVASTPEQCKQWCIDNGLQIVYEKATPTTISTPPTDLKLLKGTNNLSADGVMQIGYQPDNALGQVLVEAYKYTDEKTAGSSGNYMEKGVDYVTAGQKNGSTLGLQATIEGSQNVAASSYAHAEGTSSSVVAGIGAHAEGLYTLVGTGKSGHAEGAWTTVGGNYGHAEGYYTSAYGQGAHAEGFGTSNYCNTAAGTGSHVEGIRTTADDIGAHAEGYQTYAYGEGAHAEGYYTSAYDIGASAGGQNSCASGYGSIAYGNEVYAEGQGAHAVGAGTTAIGNEGPHAEGINTYADGDGVHAEGENTTARGRATHAEGLGTSAEGNYSHAEGYHTSAYGDGAHAEGGYTTAYGIRSHVGGMAIGNASHAEGCLTYAKGIASHAEGQETTAYGEDSHAEGMYTTAYGNYSHTEGRKTYANGDCTHAEGFKTSAIWYGAHAEGNGTCAEGNGAHAEGDADEPNYIIAKQYGAHAEGYASNTSSNVIADGYGAHAEGWSTSSVNSCAHAEGYYTCACGWGSHAGGAYTTASNIASFSTGHYNAMMTTGGDFDNQLGTAFAIGNGMETSSGSQLSNAFSVQYDGTVAAAGAQVHPAADYAEFFEWVDGNPRDTDRVGYFVTTDKTDPTKITLAEAEDDYVLGIVSGAPCVIGNGDCDVWNGMTLKDEFGRVIYEEPGVPKYNPKYDPSQPYIPRMNRKEWAAVGMLGVLPVRDDSTCQVGGFCTVGARGIATKADRYDKNGNCYKVIERINNKVIKVIFK
jgi:hypothetical protein